MPGSYGAAFSAAAPEARPGSEPRGGQAGKIVLGCRGGRVMEYSERRAPALPGNVLNPSNPNNPGYQISTRGLVGSYDPGDPGNDVPPTLTAKFEDDAGNEVDFGPLFETVATLTLDRWWPKSDWALGIPLHLVGGGEGADPQPAAGQWCFIEGRSPSDPWQFILDRPFVIAPAEDDVFEIGALQWMVFPAIAAPPLQGRVQVSRGEVIQEPLAGDPRGRIEIYRSGDPREIDSPTYPFKPGVLVPQLLSRQQQADQTVADWGCSDASGNGSVSRKFQVAYAHIIGYEDIRLKQVAYEVELTDYEQGGENG